jgi:hypothetical protein
MQDEKKQILKNIIGNLLKEERMKTQKSLLMFSYENSISSSALNYIERGLRDSQVSTLWKILDAHNIKMSDFFKQVEEKLPEKWTMLDE